MIMGIDKFFHDFLPDIESELQAAIDRTNGSGLDELRYILAYHMGWEGPGAGLDARGKRIRPMLVLLTTAAAGGDWKTALPAASAVELIHNFSLIHDDIEDNSSLRRGRPTVWKEWGIAQATNAGDALFALAHLELLRLSDSLPATAVIQAARSLNQTCLHLTQGQYLDLSYEQRLDLTEADYWPMIEGKTSALLAACTEIGAMIASAPAQACQSYKLFGSSLGLAFQAQDDLLGIWGNAVLTGKSNESDLVTGKKTLPVLFGLSKKGAFYHRWLQGSISPQEAPLIANLLAEEGAQEYTMQQVDLLTDQAIHALSSAHPQGEAGAALAELANQLLHRRS
jgi:geranylgeranyl diphosphate synthase type I